MKPWCSNFTVIHSSRTSNLLPNESSGWVKLSLSKKYVYFFSIVSKSAKILETNEELPKGKRLKNEQAKNGWHSLGK